MSTNCNICSINTVLLSMLLIFHDNEIIDLKSMIVKSSIIMFSICLLAAKTDEVLRTKENEEEQKKIKEEG